MVALAEGGTARGALVSEDFLPPLFSFRFWSVCFSFLELFAEKAERSGA